MKKYGLCLLIALFTIPILLNGNNIYNTSENSCDQIIDTLIELGPAPGPRSVVPVIVSYYPWSQTLNCYFNLPIGTASIEVQGEDMSAYEVVNTTDTRTIHIPISAPGMYTVTITGDYSFKTGTWMVTPYF